MKTLVVLPTYDEAANVREVLQRVRSVIPAADILVVDDNSPDGTATLAQQVADELGQIEVLIRERKDGLGNAYRHGFRKAFDDAYEVVVQMDADLSHDPAVIPALVARVVEGAEMVVGSRYVPGGAIPHWPWYRRALSRYGNRYACAALQLPVSDATSGFRAYQTSALADIDVFTTRSKGYGFQIETAYRMGMHGGNVDEFPIVFADRVRGYSKMSFSIIAEELTLVTWWGLRDRLLRRKPRPAR
ncbi:MAG: polyprenol monophosphomannose synthase [Acidimicrobiales bacterium]